MDNCRVSLHKKWGKSNILTEASELEYAVSFFRHSVPYGYAVIAFQDGDAYVKEGQIAEGIEGLRARIVSAMDEEVVSFENLQISNALVELAPMQYAVVTRKDGEETRKAYDNCGNQYNLKEVDVPAVLANQTDEYLFGATQYNSGSSIIM